MSPRPRLEDVRILGAPNLPPAVAAAIAKARAAAPPKPKVRRKAAAAVPGAGDPAPVGVNPLAADGDVVAGEVLAGEAPPEPLPRALEATAKAIRRAWVDHQGFARVFGAGVVDLKISPQAQGPALEFLATLLAAAEARGWRLLGAEGAALVVESEPVRFRLEEQPRKTLHEPTDKELAAKRDRDRWGGDSQPWPIWDLSPSGRLALKIEENSYSVPLR